MAQYRVRAVPWSDKGKPMGYELHITDSDGAHVGVTQSHGIQDAVFMAKDYIRLQTELPVEQIGVLLAIDPHGSGS